MVVQVQVQKHKSTKVQKYKVQCKKRRDGEDGGGLVLMYSVPV